MVSLYCTNTRWVYSLQVDGCGFYNAKWPIENWWEFHFLILLLQSFFFLYDDYKALSLLLLLVTKRRGHRLAFNWGKSIFSLSLSHPQWSPRQRIKPKIGLWSSESWWFNIIAAWKRFSSWVLSSSSRLFRTIRIIGILYQIEKRERERIIIILWHKYLPPYLREVIYSCNCDTASRATDWFTYISYSLPREAMQPVLFYIHGHFDRYDLSLDPHIESGCFKGGGLAEWWCLLHVCKNKLLEHVIMVIGSPQPPHHHSRWLFRHSYIHYEIDRRD